MFLSEVKKGIADCRCCGKVLWMVGIRISKIVKVLKFLRCSCECLSDFMGL